MNENEIKNVDIINNLSSYFMKQDKEVICRALASTMIDIHRFVFFEKLTKSEGESLLKRSVLNSDQLIKFVMNGEPSTAFKIYKTNSDKE